MVDGGLLWTSGARKEALELLVELWSHAELRNEISGAILAGPPSVLIEQIHPDEREKSRDRRIFDRIAVLERLPHQELTPELNIEWERLRSTYPNWQVANGEQALFSVWTSSDWGGSRRSYSVDSLRSLDVLDAIEVLEQAGDDEDDVLETWRELGNSDPDHSLVILEEMARTYRYPVEVWQKGLWGIRDSVKHSNAKQQVFKLLLSLPEQLLNDPRVSDAVADIVDAASGASLNADERNSFWRLFDLALGKAALDMRNSKAPDDDEWVSSALNCSMGRLATAFFAALFERDLRVGAGIPDDLLSRLDLLISPAVISHRPARVIAASRLSYLYAVDPKWARGALIPSFNWEDETESLAVWQGFGWQPRIDEKLWQVLKPHFFSLFTPERVVRLGDFGERHAQLLVVVGIEFGVEELPLEDARNAVLAMPARIRSEALSWIAEYLSHRGEEIDHGSVMGDGSRAPQNVDRLWVTRVWPLIDGIWPRQLAEQVAETSIQFARIAIGTEDRFAEAVTALRPFFVPGPEGGFLRELRGKSHPERFPTATFELIDRAVDPLAPRYGQRSLGGILTRILQSRPEVAQSVRFAIWQPFLAESAP